MGKYQKETTVNNTEFITDIANKAKSPLLATLAIRLVKCIDDNGITQAEVCEKTGIFPSNLSDYIHGKIEPKISQVDKLAQLFNVSTDYLLGRAECKKPSIEEIHKKTGLSDECINALGSLNEHQKTYNMSRWLIQTINHLIAESGLKENKFINQGTLLQQIARYFNLYGNAKNVIIFKNGDITSTLENYYTGKEDFTKILENEIVDAIPVNDVINSSCIFNIQLKLLKSKADYINNSRGEQK